MSTTLHRAFATVEGSTARFTTPDGRRIGEPLAPGANPMHGRDRSGALAAMKSIAHIDYADCRDGISYTFSMIPSALGKTDEIRVQNLTAMLDGYSGYEAHHININIIIIAKRFG